MNFIIPPIDEIMSFLHQIEQQWRVEIQPVIEDLYECLSHMIEHGNKTDLFRCCQPVDLYTKIYQMTTHCGFDFAHLDFLYQQELHVVMSFCDRFSMVRLEDVRTHVRVFQILIQWCLCFFHHLNRLRDKTYHNLYTIRENLVFCIRDHYLLRQKNTIALQISSRWSQIRETRYRHDVLLTEIMRILHEIYPSFYHDLFLLFCQELQDYVHRESRQWSCQLVHMQKTNQLFVEEEKMFVQYFHQHNSDEISLIQTILRKVLVFPYYDKFLHDTRDGWKAHLSLHDTCIVQISYDFYSRVSSFYDWLQLYQDFLMETLHSFDSSILPMNHFFQDQRNMLHTVFKDPHIQRQFTMRLETTILNVFEKEPLLVSRLIKTLHQFLLRKQSTISLQQISSLIQFCPEKDVVHQLYHHYLKLRLLSGKHMIDNERFLLRVLQQKFGISFVLNLSFMLDEIQTQCISDQQISVFRLSRVVWNMNHSRQLLYSLPRDVQMIVDTLCQTWQERIHHKSIRLHPLPLEGIVTLSFQEYEFIMSPIQAIVLMALEIKATREELVRRLQIVDDEHHNLDGVLETLSGSGLIRFIHGVWHPKRPCLSKSKTMFVPQVKKKKQVSARIETPTHPLVVEAWIVRTMKQHQEMPLSILSDMVQQSFHTLPASEFKKILHSLTEREYLSHERNSNSVRYLP